MALTYSRGAFITMAVLVCCLLLWKYIRPGRLALAGLVLAGIVAAMAPGVFSRVASIGGVGVLGQQDAKVEPDGAIRGRATEMLAALAVFIDHPFLGVGPGQYVPFYSERYQMLDEVSFRHLPRPREAHNLYFSIGAELGAAGLVVFFLIVATLFAWTSCCPAILAPAKPPANGPRRRVCPEPRVVPGNGDVPAFCPSSDISGFSWAPRARPFTFCGRSSFVRVQRKRMPTVVSEREHVPVTWRSPCCGF